MPRVPALLLPVLAAALWPHQGQAQEGPSFNCNYAQTATEAAICGDPELAQLEMRMFESYLGLVDAVGERRARRIADRFLERRQACGDDVECIARRLVITMRVFERRAGRDTEMAAMEPTEDELTGLEAAPEVDITELVPELEVPEPAPVIEEQVATVEPEPRFPEVVPLPMAREDLPPGTLVTEEVAVPEPAPVEELDVAVAEPPELAPSPEEDLAAAEPPAAEADLPLAAQAPDLDPAPEPEDTTDLAAVEPPPTPEEMDQAIEGAELASSGEAAPFDQPISWAFMDLIRHQRADIQARLEAAGYYQGPAEGSWDRATLDAFEAFFASDEGQGFDPTTENGAALALDFIRSDAFAQTHGFATEEVAAEEAAPDPNDPLTSTEW